MRKLIRVVYGFSLGRQFRLVLLFLIVDCAALLHVFVIVDCAAVKCLFRWKTKTDQAVWVRRICAPAQPDQSISVHMATLLNLRWSVPNQDLHIAS